MTPAAGARTVPAMPIAEARYDLQVRIGNTYHPVSVVMHEERDVDADGMPGKLRGARLVRAIAPPGRPVTYERRIVAGRPRWRLLLDGRPFEPEYRKPDRVYLRWRD